MTLDSRHLRLFYCAAARVRTTGIVIATGRAAANREIPTGRMNRRMRTEVRLVANERRAGARRPEARRKTAKEPDCSGSSALRRLWTSARGAEPPFDQRPTGNPGYGVVPAFFAAIAAAKKAFDPTT
jgi:hypothetical protein